MDDFDRLYAFMHEQGLSRNGLSAKTVQKVHGILRQALQGCRAEAEVGLQPDRLRNTPEEGQQRGEDEVVRAMTKEEAGRFLRAACEDRYSALFHVLLVGAFALTWAEVDFDDGSVRAIRSLNRVGLDQDEHPKGGLSNRPRRRGVVALHPFLRSRWTS